MKKTLLFIMMLLPIAVSAAEIDGINFSLDSKTKTAKVIRKTYRGEVVIPKSIVYKNVTYTVTAIDNYAFQSCKGLTSVSIPNSVTSIRSCAFDGCSGLLSLTIPNSVTEILGGAFANCSSLSAIIIPNSVVSIGGDAFKNCTSLTSITFGKGLTTIGKYAFGGCSSLQSVSIPDNVKTIKSTAFDGCSSLTSVTIGNGVTEILANTFHGCTNLTSVIIGNNVTSISGFGLCKGLRTLTIPNGVTTIISYTFQECRGLSSIFIPSSVTSIGSYAFNYCESLTSVIVDIQEPISIGYGTFYRAGGSLKATLYVPRGCAGAYAKASIWKSFYSIKEFVKKGDVVYTIDGPNTVTAKAPTDPTIKDAVIPKSINIDGVDYTVTAIDKEAFIHKKTLTVASIPESINAIGNSAFAGCSGLKAIYSYAENPIALGSSDGDENTASTVFADVDKQNCILYVPKNSINKYSIADGWKEFLNIVEIKSESPYDANNDGKFDINNIYAIVDYIMLGKTDGFIFRKADANGDNKVDAADIVEIVDKIK